MKAAHALISTLVAFFAVLNMFGGIVSGIWLAVIGEWWAIGLGLCGVLISHFIISIALMPNFAIGTGAIAFVRSGSKFGVMLMSLLSYVYISLLLTAWCIFVLMAFMSRAESSSWIPLLIWSYGAALGPWHYLAKKDLQSGSGEDSARTTVFAQIGYVVMVIFGLVSHAPFIIMGMVFGGVMLVNVAIQFLIAYSAADHLILMESRNVA